MGFAIAEEFASRGATVTLVTGPVGLSTSHPSINLIRITTAAEMYAECMKHFESAGIVVLSAAVADFSPLNTYTTKLKREKENLKLELKPTIDIAASLGKIKREGQILVGFALETDNELENAKSKLNRKNLDLIVLNSLKDKGAGFGTDTNKVTFIDKDNKTGQFGLKAKKEVAADIADKVYELLQK